MAIEPLRVLVVDDHADLRMLLGLMLRGDPRFEVVGEAADGVEALEMVRSNAPDLVLLDLEMPRRNGLEVLAELDDEPSRPVVVVLSGVATAAVSERAMRAGAVAVVGKDAPPTELLARLVDLYASAVAP